MMLHSVVDESKNISKNNALLKTHDRAHGSALRPYLQMASVGHAQFKSMKSNSNPEFSGTTMLFLLT